MNTERTVRIQMTETEAIALYGELTPAGKSTIIAHVGETECLTVMNRANFKLSLEQAGELIYEPESTGLHKIVGICTETPKPVDKSNDALPPSPDKAKAGEYKIVTSKKQVYVVRLNLDTSEDYTPRNVYPELLQCVTILAENIEEHPDRQDWLCGYAEICHPTQ